MSENMTPCRSSSGRPGRLEPVRPVLVIVEVQQQGPKQVRRLIETADAIEQHRTAERGELDLTQQFHRAARPIAIAIGDEGVDLGIGDIVELQRRHQT